LFFNTLKAVLLSPGGIGSAARQPGHTPEQSRFVHQYEAARLQIHFPFRMSAIPDVTTGTLQPLAASPGRQSGFVSHILLLYREFKHDQGVICYKQVTR
jgi:hypothetical protein